MGPLERLVIAVIHSGGESTQKEIVPVLSSAKHVQSDRTQPRAQYGAPRTLGNQERVEPSAEQIGESVGGTRDLHLDDVDAVK
jgi:hypothetical protein